MTTEDAGQDDHKELLNLVRGEIGDEHAAEISQILSGSKSAELSPDLDAEPGEDAPVEPKKLLTSEADSDGGDIRSKLAKLSKPEKLKAAMFGNSVVRRLLIFDPGRLTQEAVLGNPRLTLPEVEEFTKSTSIDSQVLRSVAAKSNWMRSYKIKLHLVTNAKCPQDISLKWLKYLHSNDIKNIARSRNVPQSLQTAAKKLLAKEG